MKIIAIDPSKSTGISFYNDGKITSSLILLEGEKGEVYKKWYDQLIAKIMLFNPDAIIQESFFTSGKFCQGVDVNFVLRGITQMICHTSNTTILECSPSEWKKYISTRSTPTKEQKELWKTKANKKFIQEALDKDWGIQFPEKLGKKQLPSDIVDSVGILLYGIYLLTKEKPKNYTYQSLTTS
jgi:hypothetical protein